MIYDYKGNYYPDYLKAGNAQGFIEKCALHFCRGRGLDIGGYDDWVLEGARSINITSNDGYHAMNLPGEIGGYDYIFSSHTLEHVDNYVEALDYWKLFLRPFGVLFLYLPHYDMEYWRPQNNRKHIHQFNPREMRQLLLDMGFKQVLHSDRDMNWSFSVVGFNG